MNHTIQLKRTSLMIFLEAETQNSSFSSIFPSN